MNQEEELYFKVLSKQGREAWTIFKNPMYRGALEIAQNLYKDKAHFVYELLHNADNQRRYPFLNEDKKPEQVEFDVMAESLDKKYLLVDECKWTTQENGKQLTGELLRKANLLLFIKNYTIVPVLFLKSAPKDDAGNAMLPEDVIELMK